MADWKTLADKLNIDTSIKLDPRESGQPMGCGVVGCWGTDSQGRKTLNGKLWIEPKQVLCNDGTFDVQAQETSGMGKVAIACNNKGGIAKNQPTPTTQGSNKKEPIYYIAVTTGVLVVSYLLYKKFKK
jgi:hypothetical protein